MSLQSFRSALLLAALVLGAATFPSSLSAQRGAIGDRDSLAAQVSLIPPPAPVATGNPASTAGPRIAAAGFTRPVATSLPSPARPTSDSHTVDNTNVAIIGVGAATVGLGLMIGGEGGTIVAISGGVIGLVGLYRYLR